MKFRGTLIWIAVFVALAAYVGLVELPSGKKEREEKNRAEKLLLFENAEVEALTLERGAETIEVKRLDTDSWQLEQPLKAKASHSAIDPLLHELETARHSRIVEQQPEDLALYGLDAPTLTATVHLKGGTKQSLMLGDASPIGHARYVKVDGDEAVYLSMLDMRVVNKSANDLRDRTLFRFQTAKVQRFEVRYQDEAETFVKEGDRWRLSGKVNGLADTDEVMNFLNAVQTSSAMDFIVEQPGDLGLYGLQTPRIVFNASLDGDADKTVILRVGALHKKEQHYAQLSETGNVFTIHQSLISTLSRNFVTFLDKKLFAFDENDLATVTIQNENETVVLQRDAKENTWALVEPRQEAVNITAVNSLLFDLKDVRVKEFIEAKNLPLFGLENPDRVLTVKTADGKPVSIRLGHPNMKKDVYFAQRTSDNAVFALSAEAVAKLFRSRRDLRDRKLLAVDAEQVARIVLEYPDRTFQLKRSGQDWSLSQPEIIDPVPAHVGKGIVWTLNNLEFETSLSPEQAPEETGLQPPVLRVTVENRDKQPLARIHVGRAGPEGTLHYARVDGKPGLYQIKSRFLDEIPATLDRFREKAS
ncbi:DUF4340 domain-containing protein [Nitrospina watsonii]|uniref:DUF4340 domain-containing protein n=1 Tax=Nitrospina watsonii TaxID=1323948 RepID=A0ABM9HFR6_9BACT|nr:DUF4340 domain-containing protein [Nitrospina watsonii]CAI2719072.1 conserved protein of unknown function [Nitrospina watsonii]